MVSPGTPLQRPVLTVEVYPFIRQRSHHGQLWAVIQAKIVALIGREVTFAGSTLLSDPFARRYFQELRPFFQAGIIVPDLRDEAESFVHLAYLRASGTPGNELLNHAAELDANVARRVRFDPRQVGELYKAELTGYLESLLAGSKGHEDATQLDNLRRRIEAHTGPPGLPEIKSMAGALQRPAEFRRMADFLYCTTGASVVGADIMAPGYLHPEYALWAAANLPAGSTGAEMKTIETLFWFLGIDTRKFAYLSPERVLELRGDGRVIAGVLALRRLAGQAAELVEKQPGALPQLQDEAQSIGRIIGALVERAYKREEAAARRARVVTDIVMDQVPYIGAWVKKGFCRLWTSLSSNPRAGWATRRFTPLLTFSSLVREELAGWVNGPRTAGRAK